MDARLRDVYTGNVHDRSGDAIDYPGCGKPMIERDWCEILGYVLDAKAHWSAAPPIDRRFGLFDSLWGPGASPLVPCTLSLRGGAARRVTWWQPARWGALSIASLSS